MSIANRSKHSLTVLNACCLTVSHCSQTYYNNQHRQEDKEVYCCSHVPRIGPGHLDNSSVGIRSALNVPKGNNIVNEQIRGHSRGRDSYETDGKFYKINLLIKGCGPDTYFKFCLEYITTLLVVPIGKPFIE